MPVMEKCVTIQLCLLLHCHYTQYSDQYLNNEYLYYQDIQTSLKSIAFLMESEAFQSKAVFTIPALFRCYTGHQRVESNHGQPRNCLFHPGIFHIFIVRQRLCEHQMLITCHQWICKIIRLGGNEGHAQGTIEITYGNELHNFSKQSWISVHPEKRL